MKNDICELTITVKYRMRNPDDRTGVLPEEISSTARTAIEDAFSTDIIDVRLAGDKILKSA